MAMSALPPWAAINTKASNTQTSFFPVQHAGELPGKIPHHFRANGLTSLGAKARRRFPVLSSTGYEPNEVE
jgi:hypothetical protein